MSTDPQYTVPYQPQPGYGPPAHPPVWSPGIPGASGLAMKRRNEWAVWLLWPLLTLGIYSLVWYYKIHREMAEFDRRRAVPTTGPLLVLIFLGWTVIAPLVSYYNCGTRIRNAQRAAGLSKTVSPGLGCFLMLIFGVGHLYYQMALNDVTDRYPGAAEGTQVPLYV